jgi:arsenical pump membrane protein
VPHKGLTPWASLATLLWASRCRAAGVWVNWWRFGWSGLVLVVPLVLLSTVAF